MDSRRSDVGSQSSPSVDSMSVSSSSGGTPSCQELIYYHHLQHTQPPTTAHHNSNYKPVQYNAHHNSNYKPTHNSQNPNITPDNSMTADPNIIVSQNPAINTAALQIATDVALTIKQIFPSLDFANNSPPWLKKLVDLLAAVFSNSSSDSKEAIVQKLRQHLRQTPKKTLCVDLVAASILQLHPQLIERGPDSKTAPIPSILPSPLKDRVATGLFVPISHLLYGEALLLGNTCHVHPNGEQAPPEPYPLSLDDPPPAQFVKLIKKVDILRSLSTHAYTLALRFPSLAGDMHGLTRHMSILLFSYKLPVNAAFELYDAFFREFERQLCLLTVMPLDQFPPWLVESVVNRYTQPTTSLHSPNFDDLLKSNRT